MIKIAHEMPTSFLMNGWDMKYCDYSYALVHLFEDHEDYYNYFVACLKEGREVILDNSIFELNKAFDADVFVEWIKKLVADAGTGESLVYVIPDVLDDAAKTISNMKNFKKDYPDLPGKSMAVAQGKTFADITKCFAALRGEVDRVGISFNCEAYDKEYDKFGTIDRNEDKYSQLLVWKKGRHMFMEHLYHLGLLEGTAVHLLGAALPDEFGYYTKVRPEIGKSIVSIDTSNPVVHGLLGIRYDNTFGLKQKESIKLAEMIDMPIADVDLKAQKIMMYNLDAFRTINGLQRPIPGLFTA